MTIKQYYLTENPCYKKGEHITPKGIMLHSTGANNPNLRRYIAPDDGLLGVNKYDNHWNQKMSRNVCVHAFIGKLKDGTVAAYQTLPWTMRGWHCGDSGNDTHISIEICEDDLRDGVYFETVYYMAAELVANLCREFDLDPLEPGVLIDHSEGHARDIASNHGDVKYWFKRFGTTMDDFRADVARILNEEETDMTKEEVAALVQAEVNAAVSNAMGKHYTTIGEVPAMYRPELDKLVAKGYLKGRKGQGEDLVIDLSENNVRTLVIMTRILDAAGAM